ncbi:alpha/beta fold hydrolase [Ectothiorhodospiraceae bacterium BW-2]|nr:alpha/beta fold hydrolase [Ectothiorhodospiraceae bacterium BW-2]
MTQLGLGLFLSLCFTILPLRAEVLLLLPGYHERALEWHYRGASAALLANGWSDGGILLATADGVKQLAAPQPPAAQQPLLFVAELPTEAPLELQMQVLAAQIGWIKQRYPGEKLHLAGHSAGGVVARLFMVRYPNQSVASLTTISSPHLGTALAEAGRAAADSPLSPILPFLGAQSLNRSEGLMRDLSRESRGNILFWLNRQPHPESRYLSIVRAKSDWVVSKVSQNMNFVPALAQRSDVIFTAGDHNLTPHDGDILLRFLSQ